MRFPSPGLVIACLALLLAAGGTSYATVAATGNPVNIVDPVTAANKAKVTGDGKLNVGDGNGPLTVDGTVGSRPVAPSSPFHAVQEHIAFATKALLLGPTTSPVNITSVTAGFVLEADAGSKSDVLLLSYHVPDSASSCSNGTYDETLWEVDGISAAAPFAQSFPTPIRAKPAGGTKLCLYAANFGSGAVTVSASGFLG
jgi:hypothetical protein